MWSCIDAPLWGELQPSGGDSQARSPRPATHQVGAVGVHAAQGPPARVRVVVLGVGLHAARVVAQGAADEENSGSVWASPLGRKLTEPAFANCGQSPILHAAPALRLRVPRSDSAGCPVSGGRHRPLIPLHRFSATQEPPVGTPVPFPMGQGRDSAEERVSAGQDARLAVARAEKGLGHRPAGDADGGAQCWASTPRTHRPDRDRPREPVWLQRVGAGAGTLTRSPA